MGKNEAMAISNALVVLKLNVGRLAGIQRELAQKGDHAQASSLQTATLCIAHEANKLLAACSDALVEASIEYAHEEYTQLIKRVAQYPRT